MSSLPTQLGRYQVVDLLATGGMAEILRCRVVGPHAFEQRVVLKRILPHLARDPDFVDMFVDEARIVAKIRHSNVVTVHELASHGDELFLVMEYLEGENAAAFMSRLADEGRQLPHAVAAHIVAEACAGLHAAHQLVDDDGNNRGLVHRDVTPHNLFVTRDGHIKIIDFGIAIAAGRKAKTETGHLKGKFSYMSPEQCVGDSLDRRSDIFSLGVVLYELATGQRLFKRSTDLMTLRAICEEPIAAPSTVDDAIGPELDQIVMRALSRRREDRYPSAAELRRDLLAYIGGCNLMQAPNVALETLSRQSRPSADAHTEPSRTAAAWVTASLRTPNRARIWLLAVIAATLVVAPAVAWRISSDEPAARLSLLPTQPPPAPLTSSAEQPAEVAVSVHSSPAGAVVEVDGEPRGTTPIELSLPRGRVAALAVKLAGYEPYRDRVAPEVDQHLRLHLKRAPVPASRVAPTPDPRRDFGRIDE